MKTKHFLLILFLFISCFVYAANDANYDFKHITMDMGLSHNQTNDIYRDNKGFVWFSTASGLNCYDGYNISVFLNTSDSTSLPVNYVDWVRDVSEDVMLVKTNAVYSFFNKRTHRFSSANRYFESLGISDAISFVYVDSKYNIWIATDNTFYVCSYINNTLSQSYSPYNGRVVDFCQNDNVLMVVYSDGTIIGTVYNSTFRIAADNIKAPVAEGQHCLFVDSDGDFWLYTRDGKGVWFYESKERKWHLCTSSAASYFQVTDYAINGIAEDKYKNIWIASDHGGINVIDKHLHSVSNIHSHKYDDRSVISNSVRCLYYDSEDIMWIGDMRAGVSLYNESVFKFDVDQFDDVDDNDFIAQINAIEEDLKGNMWYGSNGHGLLYVNTRTQQKHIFRHSSSDNSVCSDIIVDILSSSDGKIWIGTYTGGMCYLDDYKFVSFRDRKDIPSAAASSHIWALAEDEDHNIWVGSLGKGLAMLNNKTGAWIEYTETNSSLQSNFISQIYAARDGRVYIGTSLGLSVYTPRVNTLTAINDEGSRRFSNEDINDIFVDSRGLLWVGTRNGLTVLDTKEYKIIKTFDIENGLPYNVITGIVEDADRNMWVTTTRGITNIIVNPNLRVDQYTFSAYNYNEQDGFLNCSVNYRAIKKTSYGEIIVGGDPGISCFRPDRIKYNKETPRVTFTDISVLGKPVKIGESKMGNLILPEALPYCSNITLGYSDNMFTVNFSTLSNILPEKVTFSYMLEGFNDSWITTDVNSATYTNLAPGSYVLKVNAANCDGFTSDVDSELVITILPPWWRTIWAYIVYVILFVALLFCIRMQILNREKQKYKLRQVEAEVQKNREVDELKLSFFTNVSHELRTPLSLIISPLDNLVDSTTDEALKNKLQLIHRNAHKLLNMVNQLLDFRKADVNGMQLNLSEGDLVSFVKQCCNTFFELSERHLTCNFSAAVDSLYTEFDNDKIGKVINNLLSNAFKFTPDEGRIDVWVGQSVDANHAIIKVSDTGIGIDDKYKKSIFDRFFQVPQTDSSYAGSGIGLHLVKEFVTMHNGSVSVGDNVGHGSVFVVTLPIVHADSVDDPNDMTDADNAINVSANQRPKIVVVDDNADFRTLLTDSLEDMFDVIEAKNGADALAVIAKELPDLVITDVMMPVMDGNELCRKIKNDLRISHIPVIMLTAKIAEEHKIEGLVSGADDYMPKPFNPQVLRLKINRLIEFGKKRHDVFKHQIEPEPSDITITPLDEKLIQKAIHYVEDNISNTDLSVEEMSRSLGMSRVHLYKKLLSITGRSPIEFIRVIRLKRAAQLLRDKQQNVSDVAYAVGFNNPKYFSRYFKDEFGVLPSVYQNNASGLNSSVDMSKI